MSEGFSADGKSPRARRENTPPGRTKVDGGKGFPNRLVILSKAKDPAAHGPAVIRLDVRPACWLDFTSFRMTGNGLRIGLKIFLRRTITKTITI
jgi:hypothetical protein